MDIVNKLSHRINQANTLLCVGLDPDYQRIPDQFRQLAHPQFEFNKWIINETHDYVCAYKPNTAFYESQGAAGWKSLELTIGYLKQAYPDIFTICDAKRGDIGSTNKQYARGIFDHLGFDAVTLSPYTGREGLEPFLTRSDKVSIILCKTSNPGSGEFQDLEIHQQPLWQRIARQVSTDWNQHQNCMLVVGATYPQQLKQIREIVGDMFILLPGIGAQGGELNSALEAGLTDNKTGLLVSASRQIIFADNPRQAAHQLVSQIQQQMR